MIRGLKARGLSLLAPSASRQGQNPAKRITCQASLARNDRALRLPRDFCGLALV
jgi:hypothetical protein